MRPATETLPAIRKTAGAIQDVALWAEIGQLTIDDTDALDRLGIRLGTILVDIERISRRSQSGTRYAATRAENTRPCSECGQPTDHRNLDSDGRCGTCGGGWTAAK